MKTADLAWPPQCVVQLLWGHSHASVRKGVGSAPSHPRASVSSTCPARPHALPPLLDSPSCAAWWPHCHMAQSLALARPVGALLATRAHGERTWQLCSVAVNEWLWSWFEPGFPWASYLTSLFFSALSCTVAMTTVLTSCSCREEWLSYCISSAGG